MTDDILFSKYELRGTIENHRKKIREEIDAISDERLLATDIQELVDFITEKWALDFPVLGEPEVSNERVKMEVGRYGRGYARRGDESFLVDAESFTLEVPFGGDPDLFYHRGNSINMNPPRATITGQKLLYTVTQREPKPEELNQQFDRFLSDIEHNFTWLRGDTEQFNTSIPELVSQIVEERRKRSEVALKATSGLKFKMRSRDQAGPLSMPVRRKKVSPRLPDPKKKQPNEPVLSDARYEDILTTLRDMSTVLERSPAAFAGMNEEALRFQFLVPLNGQFETDARGEVFNSSGKTDILISENGKNIFIAECKIWRGEEALLATIDQILGYLSWRDTKAAILLFNRNKDFSQVLGKIPTTMRSHSNFVREMDSRSSETEFRYFFKSLSDAQREITLSVLAFDVPK